MALGGRVLCGEDDAVRDLEQSKGMRIVTATYKDTACLNEICILSTMVSSTNA